MRLYNECENAVKEMLATGESDCNVIAFINNERYEGLTDKQHSALLSLVEKRPTPFKGLPAHIKEKALRCMDKITGGNTSSLTSDPEIWGLLGELGRKMKDDNELNEFLNK